MNGPRQPRGLVCYLITHVSAALLRLKRSGGLMLLWLAFSGAGAWAQSGRPFSETLAPEQRVQLGLEKLTPEEVRALDAAVAAYRASDTHVAAARAAAVEEYRRKGEPAVVAQALERLRREEAEKRQERITGTLLDPFRGWEGRTTFRLDNGQIWQQAAADRYYTKVKENVGVVIYKAGSGYYRLRVLDDEGAWVTVKRVQ